MRVGPRAALAFLAAASAAHFTVAALHPMLALLASVAWAMTAAVVSHNHMRPQRSAWLTLFAALQLCVVAAGSLSLLAWHRLPWARRPWAEFAEATAAGRAAVAAMLLYAAEVAAGSGCLQDSPPRWRATYLLEQGFAVLSKTAVVLTTGSVGAQLGLFARDAVIGLELNVLMSSALGLLYFSRPIRAADAQTRTHAD